MAFCKIFKKRPNTLILDEPTNHLDIVGKEALEDMLLKFEGTILFVSHDRYFINKLASSILVFENGGATYYPNTTYNEYLRLKEKETGQLEEIKVQNQPKIIPTTKLQNNQYLKSKEDNKTKAQIKKLEKDINAVEQEIEALNNNYQNPEYFNDYVKLQELDKQVKQKKELLDELTNKWYELTDN